VVRPTRAIALPAVSVFVVAASSALAAPPRQTAYDTAVVRINNDVNNTQQIPVETDYIPNVVQAENGASSVHVEALKAQAVAARSFLYYKMNDFGFIGDGQNDQVYTGSGTPPLQRHIDAAAATEREVLRFGNGINDVTIAAFYVAGTRPSTTGSAPFGVAEAGDTPSSTTEQWVTYNRGLAGNDITQTELGFTTDPPGNFPKNRGAKSQNGADFLADNGWNYRDILRFYYGADIHFEIAMTPASGTKPAPKLIESFDVDQGYFGNNFNAPQNLDVLSVTRTRVTGAAAFQGAGAQRIAIDQDEATSQRFEYFHTAGLGPNSMQQLNGATPTQGVVGTAATNLSMESIGSVGFWLKADVIAGDPQLTTFIILDDDAGGTERGRSMDVSADGLWHKYEWFLDDPAQWFNFIGGNGTMNGDYFSIDSIRFTGLTDAAFTIDNVFYDAAAMVPEPTSVALLALGAVAALSRRRRR
jgi:Stage II sporulation protein/PEP-CTERM motif